MPPEMMTTVAPTAITAKKLASVAVWMRAWELRKLLMVEPVARSTWEPAKIPSTTVRPTMTSSRPAWGALIAACDRRAGRGWAEAVGADDAGGAGVVDDGAAAGWGSW